jgi:hypothetical protein
MGRSCCLQKIKRRDSSSQCRPILKTPIWRSEHGIQNKYHLCFFIMFFSSRNRQQKCHVTVFDNEQFEEFSFF